MSRKKGTAAFAVNFEPSGQMPLDARLLVADMNELIASETYASNNYYIGMPVIVIEGKSGKTELWVLKDTTKINKEEGWQRLDADAAAINQSITDAIENLDATVGGTTIADSKHIAVQVVQENGKLKTLTVTENDIASKTALDNEVTRATGAEKGINDIIGTGFDATNTVAKAIEKEATDRATAITNAIEALDKADTAVDGQFVDSVSEDNGIITVTRKTVAADKVTANAITGGTDTVAVTGANVDAQIKSLAKTVKTVQDNIAKYEVEKVTTDIPANVEARYQVVSYIGTKTDTNKTKVGEFIDIPKDGQLQNVEVTNNESNEPTVIKFTYVLDGGEVKEVSIDLGKAIFESEMGNGMQITGNKIAIKLADSNETFLTVGAEGLKLAGVQTAINNTITTEISKLDSEKTSTDGVKVAVKVTEVDGKISAVNVTETDIASDAALTAEINRAKAAEDKIEASVGLNDDGSHKPTAGKYTSQATTIAEEIAALDAKLFEVVNNNVIDCGFYYADPIPSE